MRRLVYCATFVQHHQGAQEAPVAQERKNDKTFIALQMPTTRRINEKMANQVFDALEKGSEFRGCFWCMYQICSQVLN